MNQAICGQMAKVASIGGLSVRNRSGRFRDLGQSLLASALRRWIGGERAKGSNPRHGWGRLGTGLKASEAERTRVGFSVATALGSSIIPYKYRGKYTTQTSTYQPATSAVQGAALRMVARRVAGRTGRVGAAGCEKLSRVLRGDLPDSGGSAEEPLSH